MQELKRCPFCGGRPLIEVGLNTAYVYCENVEVEQDSMKILIQSLQ